MSESCETPQRNGAAESADYREVIFREEFSALIHRDEGFTKREGLGIKSLE